MEITLPVSGETIALKSITRKQFKQRRKLRDAINKLSGEASTAAKSKLPGLQQEILTAQAEFEEFEEQLLRDLYNVDPDELAQRDVVLLMNGTNDYSAGIPESELKKYYRYGNGAETHTE